MSFTEWGTQILLAMDEGIPVFNDGFFSEYLNPRDAPCGVKLSRSTSAVFE